MFDEIKAIIAEKLQIDENEINMETSLIKDLEADSLDAVEIIMEIEEKYGIEIPDEKAESFKNVGDIVAFVEEAVSK